MKQIKINNEIREATFKELDIVYEFVNSCMEHNEWTYLSNVFYGFLNKVEEMPLGISMAYIVASLPHGSKIKYRRQFINKCKLIYKDDKLFDGL